MVQHLLAEEGRRAHAHGGHEHFRQRAQEGQHSGAQKQHQSRGLADVLAHTIELFLAGGVLFPEDADVQLGHVGHGEAAADEEEDLHKAIGQGGVAMGLQVMHQLQNGLVQEALGVVAAANGRDAADTQRAQQEGDVQHRLFPAKAADLVEIQLVQVHVHHASGHEQHQLDEGVVHHVHHGAIGGQGAVLAQQHHHGQTHGDEADLAHGGAGQRALQVDGEQRQQRTQEHGDHRQHQQRIAEGSVAGHQVGADDDEAEHAALGEDAGEQGAGRGRGNGVRLGQPDVQREQASLGGKAHQGEPHRQGDVALIGGHGLPDAGEAQRTQLMPEQEQTHQRGEAADHRHRQISGSGAHGTGGLLLSHPGIAGQGHDLKEDEGGVQIIGEEHAQGGAQGHQVEEIVAVAVVVVGEVFVGEQAAHHPHEGCNAGIQAAEAVHLQVQAKAAEALPGKGDFAVPGQDAQGEGGNAGQTNGHVAPGFAFPADEVAHSRHHHGAESQNG